MAETWVLYTFFLKAEKKYLKDENISHMSYVSNKEVTSYAIFKPLPQPNLAKKGLIPVKMGFWKAGNGNLKTVNISNEFKCKTLEEIDLSIDKFRHLSPIYPKYLYF